MSLFDDFLESTEPTHHTVESIQDDCKQVSNKPRLNKVQKKSNFIFFMLNKFYFFFY